MRKVPSSVAAIVGFSCWISILVAQGAGDGLEQRARREFNSGDYGSAARDFAELTKRDSGDIFSHILLGMALFRQERYADSVPSYEKALALEKDGRDISTDQHRIITDQLAIAYGIGGQFGKVHDLLNEAIRQDPEYPLNYYNLACTFAEEGNKAKLLANLDLAFQRRANVLKAEHMPDPRADSSFQKYVGDADFVSLMKRLGLP